MKRQLLLLLALCCTVLSGIAQQKYPRHIGYGASTLKTAPTGGFLYSGGATVSSQWKEHSTDKAFYRTGFRSNMIYLEQTFEKNLFASKGFYGSYVELKWEVANYSEQITRFLIYRKVYGSIDPLVQVASIDGAERIWRDDYAESGVMYEYTVFAQGVFSIFEPGFTTCSAIGFRIPNGRVAGKITYAGGIGVPGVSINAETSEGALKRYSLLLNGTSSFVEVPGSDAKFKFDNAFTFQGWFRPTTKEQDATLFQKGGQYKLRYNHEEIEFFAGDKSVKVTLPFKVDTFFHAIAMRNKDTLELLVKYDADRTYSVKTTFTGLSASFNTTSLNIGKGDHGYFSGYVDEVRIWQRAFTPAEILPQSELYITGTETNLSAYYRMDEGLEKSTYDISRKGFTFNEFHATLNNATWTDLVPQKRQITVKAFSDGTGNYVISGIPYPTDGTTYRITAKFGEHEFEPDNRDLHIGPENSNYNDVNFLDKSSFEITGVVRYKGTEHGVSGVQIRIDGITAVETDGTPVESKISGAFTCRVPIGHHTLKFEKFGHTFENGKFPESGTYDFQKPLTFQDDILDVTTVKLIGRLVGGPVQAAKKLAMGKSENNIGQGIITLKSQTGHALSTNTAEPTTGENKHWFYRNADGLQSAGKTTTSIPNLKPDRDKIVINPDDKTGEFVVNLLPEIYEVVEISSAGYTKDKFTNLHTTIDLTTAFPWYLETDTVQKAKEGTPLKVDSVKYQARQNFIYRSDPVLTAAKSATDPAFWDRKFFTKDAKELEYVDLNGYPKAKWPIFQQGKDYSILISVFEPYTDGTNTSKVAVTDGLVTVVNGLASNTASQSYPVNKEGTVTYKFKGGLPNLTGDNLQSIDISASVASRGSKAFKWEYKLPSGATGDQDNGIFKAYLLGARSLEESDFVTQGPNDIDMIIRDPYGSNSYSWMEKGQSRTRTRSYSGGTAKFENEQVTLDAGGTTITFTGLGAGTINVNEKIQDATKGVERTKDLGTDSSLVITTTNTARWETSSSPDFVGGDADIIIGASSNITYGQSQYFGFRPVTTCATETYCLELGTQKYQLDKVNDLYFNPKTETFYQYSVYHIKNELIPSLKAAKKSYMQSDEFKAIYTSKISDENDPNYFANNTDNIPVSTAKIDNKPAFYQNGNRYSYTVKEGVNWTKPMKDFTDKIAFFNTSVENWERVLKRNEDDKLKAKPIRNLSYDAGASVSYEERTDTSRSRTQTYSFTVSPHFAAEKGFEVLGMGVVMAIEETETERTDSSNGEEVTESIAFGYMLSDPDQGDYFSIDVKESTEKYGPVFSLIGGQSSCPHEGVEKTERQEGTQKFLGQGTVARHMPQIVCKAPKKDNVPADKAAVFTFELSNSSPAQDGFWFTLKLDDASNPNGANIMVDGQPLGNGRSIFIPGTGSVTKTISVEKTKLEVNNYKGLKLRLVSPCEDDLYFEQAIEANFIPVCSKVNIVTPLDNWVFNSYSGKELAIKVDGYDLNYPDFDGFELQYKATTESSYLTFATYKPIGGDKIFPINGQNSITHNLPTLTLIDRSYNIRAVSTCKNGTTNYSNIVTGTKDTKTPKIFGIPEPGDGILNPGENIGLTFNESIFTLENFPTMKVNVTGELNNAEINHNAVLFFDNAYTTASNVMPLDDKTSWGIEMWVKRDDIGREQILYSQGSINFGFTEDNKFQLTLADGQTFTSNPSPTNNFNFLNAWIHLGVTYDKEKKTIAAYKIYDGQTNTELVSVANVSGTFDTKTEPVYFGAKGGTTPAKFFKGYMHDVRLWKKALSDDDVTGALKNKKLKGKELNLASFWPLNELEGEPQDLSGNHTAVRTRAVWQTLPAVNAYDFSTGGNLKIAKGLTLNAESDITYEFWFNANDASKNSVVFSNGNPLLDVEKVADIWEIGFNNGLLYAKNNNEVLTSDKNLLDSKWHHIAVVVRRKSNTSIYIDGTLNKFRNSSGFGGLNSGRFFLGATYRMTAQMGETPTNNYKGLLDEFRIWNIAKPQKLIEMEKNSRLSGKEVGLFTYFPFEYFNLSTQNYVNSLQSQDYDETVNTSGEQIYVQDATIAEVNGDGKFISGNVPLIKLNSPILKLRKDVVISDRGLIINLLEEPSLIEKTVVTISVDDVRDMFGNIMPSPEVWTAFVRNNTVLWNEETVALEKKIYEPLSFKTKIKNIGGKFENFTISGLPNWLTVSSDNGSLSPTEQKELTFTVSPGINIGRYAENIYLTSDFGYNEVLNFNLKVTGHTPDWSVDPTNFTQSMNLIGLVKIDDLLSQDPDDMVAAYVGDKLIGSAHLTYFQQTDLSLALMDIYGDSADVGKAIKFKVWDASEGKIYDDVNTPDTVRFTIDGIVGSASEPILLTAKNVIYSPIALKKGYNWVSFPVKSDDFQNTTRLMTGVNATEGDKISWGTTFAQYGNSTGWLGGITYDNKKRYLVYLQKADTIELKGTKLNPDTIPFTLTKNWNQIGYPLLTNLPIGDALRNLTPTDGDLIKAQSGFSIYDKNLGWIGTLTYMTSKLGYMYKNNATSSVTFKYPNGDQFTGSGAIDETSETERLTEQYRVNSADYASNMSILGELVDPDAQIEEKVLVAYSGDEVRGVSPLVNGRFFINVYGNKEEKLTFNIVDENGGEYQTSESINFAPDALVGEYEKPYPFNVTGLKTSSITMTEGIRVFPTIYENVVNFNFTLNKPTQVTIELFDILGKKLTTITDQEMNTGKQSYHWIHAYDGENLPVGLQVVKISYDGKVVATQKLVHTR